ncbi:MAG TPA: hypothetical protein VEY67_07060 [Candidatus Dormibacteraeota bacterium]|nr:hypothetical protein [Candidatus Dormibacteraeota bacterium]
MPLPTGLVALALALAVIVLLPTRRLFLAGWPSPWLAVYYLAVLALALLVAELRGPARFLVPILVVAYLAPFVTVRDGLARLLGGPRPPDRRPPRDVTPRDADGGGRS